MITHRPCGACRSLVSVVDGCRHWKLNKKPRQSVPRPREVRTPGPTVEDFRLVTAGEW